MDMKVSFLYLGRMEFPLFRLVETPDETKMVRSPAVAILIQRSEEHTSELQSQR